MSLHSYKYRHHGDESTACSDIFMCADHQRNLLPLVIAGLVPSFASYFFFYGLGVGGQYELHRATAEGN